MQQNNGRNRRDESRQEQYGERWMGRDRGEQTFGGEREWDRDRGWDRAHDWDRDRDEGYRMRSSFDRDEGYRGRGRSERELDSGRFIQGERMGYRSPGFEDQRYGMRHTGYTRPRFDRDDGERLHGYRGMGPRNFTRNDDRICEIVCEVLSDDDRIDASHIDVTVRNGEVTLTGTVPERRIKRLVEDVIEDLPGVQDVQNQIRVKKWSRPLNRDESLDQLNSFLRGEMSAVETYRMALEKLDKGSTARTELETCMRSHEERVKLLREQIARLGGTPAQSSGPWGVFAKVIEGGARMFGDKTAIAALEEGEDHGLRDYKDEVDRLDPEFKTIVQSRLLPQQEDTHSRMSSLKRRMSQ